MTLHQERIKDILQAHDDLVASYGHLIKSGEAKAKNRARMFKPFIMYFVKAHVRRQYEHLHKVYAAEAINHFSINESECEQLRNRSAIIKDYYETLPGLKKYYGIISAMITVASFFNFSWIFTAPLDPSNLVLAILVGASALMAVGLALLVVMEIAFTSKRRLFLHPTEANQYWEGKNVSGIRLAKRIPNVGPDMLSIYQIEDRLYDALGAKKPREIPLDVVVNVALGSFATAMVFLLSWQTIINFILSGGVIFQGIGFPIISTPVYVTAFIIKPLRKYRQRIKSESA